MTEVQTRRRGRPKGSGTGLRDMARAAEFARRYLAGETMKAIADDWHLTRQRVQQILRETGVPSLGFRLGNRAKPRPLCAEEAHIAQLYLSGIKERELKALFPDMPIVSILMRARAYGHKRSYPANRKPRSK